MKLDDVKSLAREKGIKLGKLNKADLIRAIQTQENNTPCFLTGVESCDQYQCLWRDDCFPE